MGNVNHDFWKRLVLSFQRSGRMWTKNFFMKLAEEKEGQQFFLGMWEKLSSNSSS
jgi:hypothetical protein